MSKLGEGAFGNVYLGKNPFIIVFFSVNFKKMDLGLVLAKNIPAGVGRSIVELSALKNEHNAVAVKLLHGIFLGEQENK